MKAAALRAERDGQTWFFCCEACRQKFLASPPLPPPPRVPADALYTCPMHPEVEQDHPGACPKCGMDLGAKDAPRPRTTRRAAGAGDMARRFWVGLALSIPVMILAMREMLGFRVFEEARFDGQLFDSIWPEPRRLFFGRAVRSCERAWRSLVLRSANMFTLIGMGVLAAWSLQRGQSCAVA